MIFLAADHAGYRLKEIVKSFLTFLNMEFEDLGADTDESTDDYPDYAKKLVKKMKKKNDRGFLFCGSGVGMCMAANRYKEIRAATAGSEHAVIMSRIENDANVLCLASRLTNEHAAKRFIKLFLDTPFSGESRYKRRVKKLDSR
ncbi:RpiB/LacA/LacB family sugar-phosphate isomerase [Candidatus Microgenomates bacterium]|nr:RpiB/LacA/LacB family sugar-phosphate isomerase [Candidatus Microgenomates bacterium]